MKEQHIFNCPNGALYKLARLSESSDGRQAFPYERVVHALAAIGITINENLLWDTNQRRYEVRRTRTRPVSGRMPIPVFVITCLDSWDDYFERLIGSDSDDTLGMYVREDHGETEEPGVDWFTYTATSRERAADTLRWCRRWHDPDRITIAIDSFIHPQ